jgi:hypothetical protein
VQFVERLYTRDRKDRQRQANRPAFSQLNSDFPIKKDFTTADSLPLPISQKNVGRGIN